MLTALAACQDAPSSPASAAEPAPSLAAPPRHGMQPPMVLDLSGPEKVVAGATITLVAEIRRTFLSAVPMHLSLSLPRGAVLVEGKASETLVDTEQRVVTRTYALRLDEIPSEDFEMKVSWQADSWGVTATQAYRFGRPAPRLAPPRRDGPELSLEGHRPSRGIRVTPSAGNAPKGTTP
jgi:hypothetical protein